MADVVREQPRVEVERPRCPFCHEGVEAEAAKAACVGCMAWHHEGCWGEGGGCGACGARASATPARAAPRPPRRRTAGRAVADALGEADLVFQDSAPSAVLLHRTAAEQRRLQRVRALLAGVAALAAVVAFYVAPEPLALGLLLLFAAAVACAAGGLAWLVVRAVQFLAARAEEEATGRREKVGRGPG